MHNFENDNGFTVTYDCVRKAMGDEPFTMSTSCLIGGKNRVAKRKELGG